MKILRKLIFLSSIIFSISLSAQSLNLKIIETSDIHGALYPYDFKESKTSQNSLAHIYNYVKLEREKTNQEVLLVDAGDLLQGDPSVYYYNFEKTDTLHLLADMMNYMNYDAGTIGNHDIEAGHSVYDKFVKEVNFPWLAANAIDTKTNKPYFQPYTVINKSVPINNEECKKIKIAILGMITPGIPNWLPEKIWEGIDFEDMILTAKKWMPIIKEKEKPDLIIGLFHSGVDYTYDNQTAEQVRNENASVLVAEQVPGFDIVFVGHDHHGWNFNTANLNGDSVLILGPTSRSRNVAVADINFTWNSIKNNWDKIINGSNVDFYEEEPNQDFLNKFSAQFEDIKRYVTRPIGKFTKTISAKNSLFGNSSFVDLIHKIQLELTNADISFAAPFSITAQINKGDIFIKDMFKLYHYENLLYTMELSGKEIKDYLEFSYASWFNTIKDEGDNLLQFEKDEKGNLLYSKRSNSLMLKNRYYNFDSAEGIKYIVDVSKEAGKRIKIIEMSDGAPFNLEATYKIAVNSYRGNGGGGHFVLGARIPKNKLADRIINSTEKDLRYYIMKWIENKKVVDPIGNVNWSIEPKKLTNKIIKKDYKLLFGTK